MTVTAHFLKRNWELCNFVHVLSTKMISEAHTGENLGNSLASLIQEWNLRRPSGIPVVTDNASNMDIAVSTANLGPHIMCFAHTINLASQRGLESKFNVQAPGKGEAHCWLFPQMNYSYQRVKKYTDIDGTTRE